MHSKVQTSSLNALESGSQVVDELFGVISSDANVINVLGALVCFDNFIQVFAHKAGSWKRPIRLY